MRGTAICVLISALSGLFQLCYFAILILLMASPFCVILSHFGNSFSTENRRWLQNKHHKWQEIWNGLLYVDMDTKCTSNVGSSLFLPTLIYWFWICNACLWWVFYRNTSVPGKKDPLEPRTVLNRVEKKPGFYLIKIWEWKLPILAFSHFTVCSWSTKILVFYTWNWCCWSTTAELYLWGD